MAILKVCRMGHPVLRQAAEQVAPEMIDMPEIQSLIDNMIETMDEYDGVGLAAPQVHVALRMAVVRVDREDETPPEALVLINPELQPVGQARETDWEGCLSIPDIRGRVPRWHRISVRALSPEGEPLAFEAEGFVARVIQHEVDHLDGILFLDRMEDLSSLSFKEEYFRFREDGES